MAVLPARPRKPRDKAKVEAAVLIVERWLLGRLRNRRFYGLAELNQAIAELLHHLNEVRPIRRLGATRRQLLEELDRPFLKSLPAEPYVFAEWIRREAAAIGPSAALLCDLILEQRPHPEQGFRACLGIVRLTKPFGGARVEAAASRALEIGARTYGSVKSILDNNLDRQAPQRRATSPRESGDPAILHSNIRGARYYN
jgi:transposase